MGTGLMEKRRFQIYSRGEDGHEINEQSYSGFFYVERRRGRIGGAICRRRGQNFGEDIQMKDELIKAFEELTLRAIAEQKEKDIEPELLNAIRESVEFLLTVRNQI